MIKMVDKQSIIFLYRRGGQSLREISKTLNLHRATVTKVIREYEESLKADNPDAALDTVLTTLPEYKSNDRQARVVKGEVASEIDKWLAENERRRMKGMRKQCLNAKDIHRQLLEKDMVVSYSSVCKYIARVKAKEGKPRPSKDVFIHQEYEPGIECEFDWGEVKLTIRGEQVKFTMAVFTFCHSNGRYAYIFRHQDALALMEAHRNFFREINGVPEVMVYDNMRVAVAFTEDGLLEERKEEGQFDDGIDGALLQGIHQVVIEAGHHVRGQKHSLGVGTGSVDAVIISVNLIRPRVNGSHVQQDADLL